MFLIQNNSNLSNISSVSYIMTLVASYLITKFNDILIDLIKKAIMF